MAQQLVRQARIFATLLKDPLNPNCCALCLMSFAEKLRDDKSGVTALRTQCHEFWKACLIVLGAYRPEETIAGDLQPSIICKNPPVWSSRLGSGSLRLILICASGRSTGSTHGRIAGLFAGSALPGRPALPALPAHRPCPPTQSNRRHYWTPFTSIYQYIVLYAGLST